LLPLPIFDYHRPRTLDEAVALLHDLGDKARIIAGGTDVLPNMKQGLFDPAHVVSVAKLEELRGIVIDRASSGSGEHRAGQERLVIGAGMKLAEIADSLLVQRAAPALAEACGLVGGPHHRAMGTLGGNVCLDTRCRYYNQTYFWRKALGFCIKKDGTVCHVVKGGSKCVAAASNDSAPVLIALDAGIELLGPSGSRTVAAQDFYTADGVKNTVIGPGEIVVRVVLPLVAGRRSAFEKLRRRGAIDFPLLSIAARVDHDEATAGAVSAVSVVVSSLGARPRRLRAAAKIASGSHADRLPQALADAAYTECRPLTNLDEDSDWRHEMVPVLVKKALERAALGR
jgi:4-hydroxybenzoyl-CoA reductase subunit beta